MSIGTRGDIEPFVALGEMLTRNHHEVIYAFPEQYNQLIPNKDKSYAFTPKFLDLIEGEYGRAVMSGSVGFLKKSKAILKLYTEGMAINKILVREQYDLAKNEKPDVIIHNGKCNYPLLWNLSTGKKVVLISPIPYFLHYVEGHGHTGFNGDYGGFINRLTYKIANFGLVKTIYDAQKILPEKNTEFSKKQIKEKLLSEKLIYTISPSLFSRPKKWNSNVQVLGYHERDKIQEWIPDENISRFMNEYPKIVFLTFGSMINNNPEKTTRTILNVLKELKIPTVINIAAGGLVQLEEFKENPLFYFTRQVPYDWILEKCYGIIHHGGSGTTHSGIKNGCVSMIIPHIFDQYGWNDLIAKKGIGPKGISVNKITKANLKPLIIDLYENELYKTKTKDIAKKMMQENFESELYNSIID